MEPDDENNNYGRRRFGNGGSADSGSQILSSGLFKDGGGFAVANPMAMDYRGQAKMGSRQNSIPAGFFANLTSQHGYESLSGIGNYRVSGFSDNEGSTPSPSRPKSLGTLARISEAKDENPVANPCIEAKEAAANGSYESSYFSSGFPLASWNPSSNFAENFSPCIKRELYCDHNHIWNVELENRQESGLPKTSTSMEKLLQIQDMVPCKLRAKRGCATHPRSIAERLRRTRISDRMRKLQELVPNMDKQTSTADMLDLAVEYIKNLQKQYKALSDDRINCRCQPRGL